MSTQTQQRQKPTSGGSWWKKHWLDIVVHVGGLAPLLLLILAIATNQLSVDPIRDITFRTGSAALILLIVSLACTPINTVFGYKGLLKHRRSLGLYAFFYATLHFLTFVALDYGLDPAQLQEAILEKSYALAGLAAFALLLPLAITSTKGWMKRLGKNWRRLHRLVYVAAILAIIHFVWLVKNDYTEPLIFAIILTVLLVVRIPPVSKKIMAWRYQFTRRNKVRDQNVT